MKYNKIKYNMYCTTIWSFYIIW